MSQHPKVEAKLVAELDAAELLVTPERPQPRALAYADLSRLTYLHCVLKVGAPQQPAVPSAICIQPLRYTLSSSRDHCKEEGK